MESVQITREDGSVTSVPCFAGSGHYLKEALELMEQVRALLPHQDKEQGVLTDRSVQALIQFLAANGVPAPFQDVATCLSEMTDEGPDAPMLHTIKERVASDARYFAQMISGVPMKQELAEAILHKRGFRL